MGLRLLCRGSECAYFRGVLSLLIIISLKVCILSGPTPCYRLTLPHFWEGPSGSLSSTFCPSGSMDGAACPSKPAYACLVAGWDQTYTCSRQRRCYMVPDISHTAVSTLRSLQHVVETKREGSATPVLCAPMS